MVANYGMITPMIQPSTPDLPAERLALPAGLARQFSSSLDPDEVFRQVMARLRFHIADPAFAHRLLAERYHSFGKDALVLRHTEKALKVQGARQFGIRMFCPAPARALRGGGRYAEAACAIRPGYQRVRFVAGRTPGPDARTARLEQAPANREMTARWEGMRLVDAFPPHPSELPRAAG